MRVLEDALIKSASHNVILRTRTDIALYILNQKRSLLRLIEERFGVSVTVEADDSLTGGAYHALERGEPAAGVSGDPMRRFDPRRPIEDIEPIGDAESEVEVEFEEEAEGEVEAGAESAEAGEERGEDESAEAAENRRRRRRRRGRGRNFDREASSVEANAEQPSDEGLGTLAAIGGDLIAPVPAGVDDEGGPEGSADDDSDGRRRGRGRWRRRGGRGRGGEGGEFNGDWRPTAEAKSEGESEAAPAAVTQDHEAPVQQGDGSSDFAPLPSWSAEAPATPGTDHGTNHETNEASPAEPAKPVAEAAPLESAPVASEVRASETQTSAAPTPVDAQPEPAPRAEAGPAATAGVAGDHPGRSGKAKAFRLVGKGQGQSHRALSFNHKTGKGRARTRPFSCRHFHAAMPVPRSGRTIRRQSALPRWIKQKTTSSCIRRAAAKKRLLAAGQGGEGGRTQK